MRNNENRQILPSSSLRQVLRDRQRARNQKSCLPCRERKVRCNREHPCHVCIRRDHPDLCSYPDASMPVPLSPTPRNSLSPRRESQPRKESTPSFDVRPTPPQDGLSQSSSSTPAATSLLHDSSLLAIAREDSPRLDSSATNRHNVLETAMIPLLGMEVTDGSSMEQERQTHLASQNNDPYIDLPEDHTLLMLFSVYRARVHPLHIIINDLDEIESELCSIINYRMERSATMGAPAIQPVSESQRRFLCVLHAILAAGAQFSDLTANDRSILSQRHTRCAFSMLRACNYLLRPFYAGVRALLILGYVLSNEGNPQAAWILGGSTIRMAVTLGLHSLGCAAGLGPLPVSANTARHLRLAIIWQDALLSLAFNRQPASQEMDIVLDLPSLDPSTHHADGGLNYAQAMNWLCHLTLRYWPSSVDRVGKLLFERFKGLFADIDALECALQDHLRNREACHSIQAIQEFYSFELHRNFTISTLCRPVLSKDGHEDLTMGEVDLILQHLRRALKRSVRAFTRLRSVTSYASRSWACVHNGLTSALLLSFMKETRAEEESRQIQDELIQSLTAGNDISGSESVVGGTFAQRMTNAHRKSLNALISLRKLSEEDCSRGDRSDNVRGNTMNSSSILTFSGDELGAIQDPDSVEFDDLLRSLDFSSTLPMEAFDFLTSDPITPGVGFEPFNSLF